MGGNKNLRSKFGLKVQIGETRETLNSLQAPLGLHSAHADCIVIIPRPFLGVLCVKRARGAFACSCVFCEQGVICSACLNVKVDSWSAASTEL